jgi:hypothetical protein
MRTVKVELSPAEIGYVLGLLKDHLDYYRVLSANGNCTEKNRAMKDFLENLWMKLAQ